MRANLIYLNVVLKGRRFENKRLTRQEQGRD